MLSDCHGGYLSMAMADRRGPSLWSAWSRDSVDVAVSPPGSVLDHRPGALKLPYHWARLQHVAQGFVQVWHILCQAVLGYPWVYSWADLSVSKADALRDAKGRHAETVANRPQACRRGS
jgi:hypothetical protein